jgi:putative colanic acid biosynthesis UDP-glucose lipid carrier transferase
VLHPKIDVQITLLTFLRVVLVPTVAIGSLVASTALLNVRFTEPYVALAIITALLTLLVMAREALQQNGVLGAPGLTLAGRIGIGWFAVVGVLLMLGYATKSSEIFSRRALFLWFLLTPPFLVAASLGVQQWLRALLVSSRNARSAVIVGSSRMALELARTLHQRPELGLKLRCVFVDQQAGDQPIDDKTSTAIRKIAGADIRTGGDVRQYVNTRHIDVVFIARQTHAPGVDALLHDLRDTTSSVYLIPDVSLYDLIQARVGDVDGIPVIALCESPRRDEALHRHRVLAADAGGSRTPDALDRRRDQARLAGPRVLQARPLWARWRAHRRLQVPDDDRLRERRADRSGET